MCKLGVLLDPQFLIKGQVAAMARKVFAHLWIVHQLCHSRTGRHCSLSLVPSWLLQHALYGTAYEQHLKASPGQNETASVVNGTVYSAHVTPLLHDRCWLPVQFKVLVVTVKSSYLRTGLLEGPSFSSCLKLCLIQSGRMGFGSHQPRIASWQCLERCAFSTVISVTLQNILSLEIRMAPTLMAFCKPWRFGSVPGVASMCRDPFHGCVSIWVVSLLLVFWFL